MKIWLVVKQWPNGRWEVAEAWKDEAKAHEAGRRILQTDHPVNYTISLWITELKDAE